MDRVERIRVTHDLTMPKQNTVYLIHDNWDD